MLEEAIKKEYQNYLNFIFMVDQKEYASIQQVFDIMAQKLKDGDKDKYPKLDVYSAFSERVGFEDEIGNLIFQSDQYDFIGTSFQEDRAIVRKGGLYNFINLEGKLISKEWFDGANSFKEGYASVRFKGKLNFIDSEGNLISKDWFDVADDFNEGYAAVNFNEKWNFIDPNGNYLLENWYQDVGPFNNGYARVKRNNTVNLIDKNGKFISDMWFHDIGGLCDGIAFVMKENKYNFLDMNGNLLSEKWYDRVENNGKDSLGIILGGKWNILGKDGKPMLKDWYDESSYFFGDVAVVQKDGKKNIINRAGKTLLTWSPFHRIGYFYNDYSEVITDRGEVNFMDKQGNFLFKKWINSSDYAVDEVIDGTHIRVRDKKRALYNFFTKDGKLLFKEWLNYSVNPGFSSGCVMVTKRNQKNYLNTKGVLISEEWFDQAREFVEGFAVVKKGENANLLKPDGTFLLDNWYNDILSFNHGHAIVQSGNYKNCVDQNGKFLFDCWYDDMKILANRFLVGRKKRQVFLKDIETGIFYEASVTKEDIDLAYYTLKPLSWRTVVIDPKRVEKTLFSYKIKEEGTEYSIKYEPIRLYDFFILCKKKDTYYLYDKRTKDYQEIGKESVTHGENYFIFQHRTFFVSDVITEITGIDFRYGLELKPGVKEVLSYEEFKKKLQVQGSYDQIVKEIEEEQRRIEQEKKKEQEEEERRKLEEQLKKQEKEHQEELNKIEEQRKYFLKMYQELTQQSRDLRGNSTLNIQRTKSIEEADLFIQVGDHKEIDPIYLIDHYIREFDLSYISFDHVKVSGIDLSYTNAAIDPQTVYRKDMSGGNYNGLSFIMKDFDGVSIEGSTFEDCNFDFSNFSEISKKR